MKQVNLQIFGQVQGVFFRQGVKEEAERLGLVGFVKNEADSSVSVVAEGQEEELQKLVEWCRKGTEWAKVDKVEVEWGEASGEFEEFEIR